MPFFFLLTLILGIVGFQQISRTATEERTPKAVRLFRGAILLYVAVFALTSLLGVDPWLSVWGEQSRQNGLLVLGFFVMMAFVLPVVLREQKQWRRFLQVFVWSAVVPATVATLEAIVPVIRNSFGEVNRFSAWIGNPIFLGGYLVLACMIAGHLFADARRRERIALSVAMLLCLLGTFATGSRGSVLALVAGVIVTVALWAVFVKKKGGIALSAVLLVAAFALVLVPRPFLLAHVSGPALRILDVRGYAEENAPRFLTWQIAKDAFLQHPVFGYGPETFGTAFDRLYRPELLRYSFYETVSDKPHNRFLEVLATGGIVLATSYALLFILAMWMIVQAVRRNTLSALGGATLFGFLASYFVYEVFLFEVFPTTLPLFAIFGYLLWIGEREVVVVDSSSMSSRVIPPSWIRGTAAFSFVVLALGAVYAGGFGALASAATAAVEDTSEGNATLWLSRANRALWFPSPFQDELRKYIAFDFIARDAKGAWQPAQYKEAADALVVAYDQTAARRPHDFMAQYVYGQLLTIQGEYASSGEILTKAVETLGRAHDLSPKRQVVPMQLAKIFLLGDKPQDAVRVLEEVIKEDPTIAEPHWFLGIALTASGDDVRGADELVASMKLGRGLRSVQERLYVIDALAKGKRYAEIIPLYEALIAEQPLSADLHARLAATYAEAGMPELAVLEAQRAAALDPSFKDEADRFMKALEPKQK